MAPTQFNRKREWFFYIDQINTNLPNNTVLVNDNLEISGNLTIQTVSNTSYPNALYYDPGTGVIGYDLSGGSGGGSWVGTATSDLDMSTYNITNTGGYNTYQTLGTNKIINTPSNTLKVGGVNVTAINKRTRTSHASAVKCVSTWTTQTSAADNGWRSVCWAAELGLFCAVADTGTGNRVMTSPDGITWTLQTSAVDNSWRSICWAPELGLFCAVAESGTGNRVMTSPNGITWTTRTSAADNEWCSVCWAAELGLFCAVASSGTNNDIMTSPDGITWTIRTSAADNFWTSVCWAAELGLFCVVSWSGLANRVMTSSDGITWTTRTSGADNLWNSVCWAAELGLFCAVAESGVGNRVMTSPDGINWTTRTSAADIEWLSVCWAPELSIFCVVADTGTGNRVMTSHDGINWTTRTSAADNNWRSVCWAPELSLFCAISNSGTGNRVMTTQYKIYTSKNLNSNLDIVGNIQASRFIGDVSASALTVNSAYQLPTTIGSANQVLTVPASGNILTFTDNTSGWVGTATTDLNMSNFNITGINQLQGASTMILDPAGVGDNTGLVVIKGNLQVDGTTTTINSSILDISDHTILLASAATNVTQTYGAGIEISGNKTFTYESGDIWNSNIGITAPKFIGDVSASALTVNSAYQMPTTIGSANQVLTVPASGNTLTFTTPSAGGATSIINTNTIVSTNSLSNATIGGLAIGYNTGNSQGNYSIALGYRAADTSQAAESVALGTYAGQTQLTRCVALGHNAGYNQNIGAIAIGFEAASQGTQSQYAISIGHGSQGRASDSIAIGYNTNTTSGSGTIAIGNSAHANQDNSISIGNSAGTGSTGNAVIAIGLNAGKASNHQSIAIGVTAGFSGTRGTRAIAIGCEAGRHNQGAYTIALGDQAGKTDQSANTIILNATGTEFNGKHNSGLYVKPIRNAAGTYGLFYDSGTGEITYNTAGSSWVGTATTDLDMSNYNITGINQLQGASTMILDPAGVGDNTGLVVIKGNLQVDGTTTTINSSILDISDHTILLASNATNVTQTYGAGIEISGNKTFTYALGNIWNSNIAITAPKFTGDISANTLSVNSSYILPTTIGSANQVLTVPASGNVLEFTTPSSGGATSIVNTSGLKSTNATDASSGAVALGLNSRAFTDSVALIGTATGLRSTALTGGIASGNDTISIGTSSSAVGVDTVAIGNLAGYQTTNTNYCLFIGRNTGWNCNAEYNTYIGNSAGSGTASGSGFNTYIGANVGADATGSYSVGIGYNSGRAGNTACISIGRESGNNGTRGTNAIAMGYRAGYTSQGNYTLAIGSQCGENNQGAQAIAIGGQFVGQTNQGSRAIAIGTVYTAYSNQSGEAIAIGHNTATISQSSQAIAIGSGAGRDTQSAYAISIGSGAGDTKQGQDSIAIGRNAGFQDMCANNIILNATGSALNSIGNASSFFVKPIRNVTSVTNGLFYNPTTGEISYDTAGGSGATSIVNTETIISSNTGTTSTGNYSVVLGHNCNLPTSGYNVIIGKDSGNTSAYSSMVTLGFQNCQSGGNAAIAIGDNAGKTNCGAYAVAIGYIAGQASIGQRAIAIGNTAGQNNLSSNSIAIGYQAAQNNAQTDAIAIGTSAGNSNLNQGSIAIGSNAAYFSSGIRSVYIGDSAGNSVITNGDNAICIGQNAGNYKHRTKCVCIGLNAGANYIGQYSIAIGTNAARNSAQTITDYSGCIVLNAQTNGAELNPTQGGQFLVKPIRNDATPTNVLFYNTTSGEISYGDEGQVSSDMRLKTNIEDVTITSLDIIKQLQIKKFIKCSTLYPSEEEILRGKLQVGVIAQEIMKINPELVSGGDEIDSNGNLIEKPYFIKFNDLAMYHIKATQELTKELDLANNKIQELETQNNILKSAINSLLKKNKMPLI